jgi:hypothetical protein
LLIDKTSLIYQIVKLKGTARHFLLLTKMFLNKCRIISMIKRSANKGADAVRIRGNFNRFLCSLNTKNYKDIFYELFQQLLNLKFEVLVCVVRVVFNKVVLLMIDYIMCQTYGPICPKGVMSSTNWNLQCTYMYILTITKINLNLVAHCPRKKYFPKIFPTKIYKIFYPLWFYGRVLNNDIEVVLDSIWGRQIWFSGRTLK